MMTLHTATSDEELLRLMMAGDEDAFAALYQRRQGGVYRFALRMSGSESVAEDVTQEVFIALMKNPKLYEEGRGSLNTYLYGIARNQVLRRFNRERSYVPLTTDDEQAEPTAYGALIADHDPLGDLTRNETIDAVRQAVLALPEHYREVIVLCELHEMNYAEAAEVIGCPIGTVRSRLNRARGLLTEKLKSARVISEENFLESAMNGKIVAAR